ncbi:MAG: metallophosphoesterase [Acutalibacteraceae bacterium]|nr:metallophosphoesterase [Acutalibacteraceae bacterium]
MALTDKLTAVAEAIRLKSGKTDKLTLDEMPTEIKALTTEDIIQHAEIPDYVKKEAFEVAQKVRSVQTDESIVFLAMSDTHYYGKQGESGVDTYVDGNGVQGNTSNLHAAMAAKILAYALGFDFMAHLGDAAWGHKTTHLELLNSQIDDMFAMLRESHKDLPCFHAIGNHDTGYYYGTFETGENLYNKFTALSASDKTVFGGTQYGGYCYRDFEAKKLRVFLLNTSEYHIYNQTDSGTLGSQRLWFANALLNLNAKPNATEWGYIVLSHYPADYGATMPLSELLKAYVEGSSITITTESGAKSTVNFAGKNGAKFFAQFHGHVHNFITSKLHSLATGSPVQYDGRRVCIPNGQFNRENYYGVVSGINFAEDTAYSKTADTANDTSFVVNVINPSEEKIYSFCYGAGYDRVIGFAATVYYSVSASLTNVTSSSDVLSVEAGKSYSATLTTASGYELKTVKITMGGVDVTASVYSNGVINIPEVTGNVSITAKAEAKALFKNLVPLSINPDLSDFNVDGDGYDNGTYISSSTGEIATLSGFTTTGFIAVPTGTKTIRIAGDGISIDTDNTRVGFYDANFNVLMYDYAAVVKRYKMGSSVYFGVVETESTSHLAWTIDKENMPSHCNAPYIRVCTKGDGANLIVTVDEPIKYGA